MPERCVTRLGGDAALDGIEIVSQDRWMTEAVVSISEEQRIVVRERLRLLTLAAYIRGGITLAFSCFFVIYVLMFTMLATTPDSGWTDGNVAAHPSSVSPSNLLASPSPAPRVVNPGPPKVIFRVMAGVFGGFALLGWTFGGLTAYTGWCVRQRRHKLFVLIISGLNCIFIPYGTLFGIAAILVLSSPGTKAEFEAKSS